MKGFYEQRQGEHPAPAWIINYDVERALANYHFLAARMTDNGDTRWPRVYASTQCAAIVISNTALDAVRDPHVMAWRNSFIELNRFEFLTRVGECLAGLRASLGAERADNAAA